MERVPEFIVRDGKMYVGRIVNRNEDGSITVDLYRNMQDYKTRAVMELDFTYRPEAINRRPQNDPGCYRESRPGSSASNPLH